MGTVSRPRAGIAVLVALLGLAGLASSASADHSWGSYHWARTGNPFTLKLGKNVSTAWLGHLSTASDGWNASGVLDTVLATGLTAPKQCRPAAGRVEVCNSTYGNKGWLGLAQIWISGGHITQGVVKMNDTYFTLPRYNTPAWRNHVMCQEVGHTLGLDHQDESGASLGTCMDYSTDPTNSQYPDPHDYEQLEWIYAHLDGNTTVSAAVAANGRSFTAPAEWGRLRKVTRDGRREVYERDLGGGHKVFTFVYLAF